MGDERKRVQCHTKLKGYLAIVDAHSTTAVTLAKAKEYMKRVEENFVTFETVQDKLEATAVDQSALDIQEKAGDEVEKTFTDVRGKLRELIDNLLSKPSSTSSGSTSAVAKIKLPQISLVKFDGKLENWIAFKDLFTGQIASQTQLSGAQKLQYLKSSLEGAPYDLIDDLPTTDANYLEAWRILKERYDIKREIVRAHVKKLYYLKTLKSENASELQLLVDAFVKHIRSLGTQGCPTDKWDDLTVIILEEKLDSMTRMEWAKKQTGTDTAKFTDFVEFLRSHIRGLQAAGSSSSSRQPVVQRGDKQVKVLHADMEGGQCVICRGAHYIQDCKEFLSKTPADRSSMAKKARLCFNCLRPDHMLKNCTSSRKCKKCENRHHTFLHEERGNKPPAEEKKTTTEMRHHVSADSRGVVMTVMLHVPDKHGVRQPCRAFVDPGATSDFMREFRSEACTSRLGLSRQAGRVTVTGFGDTKVGASKGIVQTTLYSRTNPTKSMNVELHCMSKLKGTVPTVKCQSGRWSHLQGLELADPRWHQPGPIDILLGIRYYHKIMLSQRILGPNDDAPVAWETIFGWVVSGACPVDEGVPVTSFHVSVGPLVEMVQRFWTAEEPPNKRILTVEEKKCEEHFVKTYKWDETGRFVVAVPFVEETKATLGRSRDIAFKRLLQVEKRLKRQPQLLEQYVEFMREYESLGHMSRVVDVGERVGSTNYLFHHFVQNQKQQHH